jgi:hypothetical protein
MYGGSTYGAGSGMYGACSSMYGSGSGMYGTGGGMYGAGSGMYGGGGGMYGGGGGLYGGGPMGALGGPPGANHQPPQPPNAWQGFMHMINGVMHFFGRLSFLVRVCAWVTVQAHTRTPVCPHTRKPTQAHARTRTHMLLLFHACRWMRTPTQCTSSSLRCSSCWTERVACMQSSHALCCA